MVHWIQIKCRRGKKWKIEYKLNAEEEKNGKLNSSARKRRRNRHSELIEKTLKEKNVYVFMVMHAETFDVVERSMTVVSRNGFHHRSNVNNNLLAIRIHWIQLNFFDAFHFIAEREASIFSTTMTKKRERRERAKLERYFKDE